MSDRFSALSGQLGEGHAGVESVLEEIEVSHDPGI